MPVSRSGGLHRLTGEPAHRRTISLTLCQQSYRFDLHRRRDHRRHAALAPGGEAVAGASGGTDERDLVGELVGHRGGGFLFLAVEVEVLNLLRRYLEAVTSREVVV